MSRFMSHIFFFFFFFLFSLWQTWHHVRHVTSHESCLWVMSWVMSQIFVTWHIFATWLKIKCVTWILASKKKKKSDKNCDMSYCIYTLSQQGGSNKRICHTFEWAPCTTCHGICDMTHSYVWHDSREHVLLTHLNEHNAQHAMVHVTW